MKRVLITLLAIFQAFTFASVFSVTGSAESVDLASGKSVTVESHVANEHSYASNDSFDEKKLTDGKLGNGVFSNSAYCKFYRATGRILYVDLGADCTVENVKINFLHNVSAGIYAPSCVRVFVSQNNKDYAEAEILKGGSFPDIPYRSDETQTAVYDISLTPVCARYVAISFDVTVNTFTDELEIYGFEGSDLTPPTEFVSIKPGENKGYISRDALGGDTDIVCFHAGYYPDDEKLVNNTKDAFIPYLAYVDEKKNIVDTMFDSILFLTLQGKCPSGGNLTVAGGTTVMSDWVMLLDNYFHPDYNLHAIDAATKDVKAALGLPDDHKTSVYLTIPYPKISDIDFGDYTGDGVSDKIDSYQACLDVTKWFMDEVEKRYNEAGFENIELKGYFCNSEGLTKHHYDYEREFAIDAAKLMHEKGLYCVMIPYYHGVGIDANDELNFDAMLMQPNLSFDATLQQDPEGMMDDFAQTAHQLGLGIQMEIADGVRWEPEQLGAFYAQYLISASQNGLMTDTIHAYYNGAGPGVFYDCAMSKNAVMRWYYDMTYKFIKGTLTLTDDNLTDAPDESDITVNGNERYTGETGVKGDWLFTYKVTKHPSNGYVYLTEGSDTYIYSADRKFSGTDSFEYEIIVNGETVATKKVNVTVVGGETEADSSASSELIGSSESESNADNNKKGILPIVLGVVGAAVVAAVTAVIFKFKKKK